MCPIYINYFRSPLNPCAPGIPSVPFLPGIPFVPGIPSSPFLPGIPSNPGSPGIPSLPSKPGEPVKLKRVNSKLQFEQFYLYLIAKNFRLDGLWAYQGINNNFASVQFKAVYKKKHVCNS